MKIILCHFVNIFLRIALVEQEINVDAPLINKLVPLLLIDFQTNQIADKTVQKC